MSTPFFFRGTIPSSKSILNRLLVLRSYSPALKVRGYSIAIDVAKMKSALASLERGEVADCGSAGTTFRFLAVRASRFKGRHVLTGSHRLFERPQLEIVHLLAQLGRVAELDGNRLIIEGGEWKPANPVRIDRSVSSQFASALVLNAWGLPAPLRVKLEGVGVSADYLEMTLELARRAGMDVRWEDESCITIASNAAIHETELIAEIDVSSAFAVAALAAVAGRAEILSWPGRESLQPDAVFPELLARMGARVQSHDTDRILIVEKPVESLHGIDVDLRNSPDLFPVLATLCAFAEGRSVLHGAPHLAHKESSRIESTAQLLASLGRRCEIQADGMIVHGRRFDPATEAREEISFDPKDDHRVAMAAAVANATGARIRVLDPETVTKSFPEFWSVAEGKDACASF